MFPAHHTTPAHRPNRILFIALLAIVAGAPYAIPVPWVALTRWLSGGISTGTQFLPSPVANQSWFIIFSSAAVALVALAVSPLRLPRQLNAVALAAFAWFAVTLLRGLIHPAAGPAHRDLLLQGSFLLLFASALAVRPAARQLAQLTLFLCITALPLAAIAISQNTGYDPLPYSATVPGTDEQITGKHLIASTFGHPNYMGSYLAPVIILAIGLAPSPALLPYRLIAAAAAASSLVALIAGGTRGPLVAVTAGLVIFLLIGSRIKAISFRKGWLYFTAAIAIAATCLVLIPTLRPAYDFQARLFASKEIASRVFYWVVGLEMFRSSPLFGVGTGQFDLQFWQTVSTMPAVKPDQPWYFILESVIRGVRPGQMHNDHLQILVETGLTGAAAWGILWIAIGYRTLTGNGAESNTAAYCGAFTAVAVDALFGFPYHLPCSGALFWVLLGLWAGMKGTKPLT